MKKGAKNESEVAKRTKNEPAVEEKALGTRSSKRGRPQSKSKELIPEWKRQRADLMRIQKSINEDSD
jgi:hypothetical protein